jgi:pyruvate dehydrogenase E1 component alpha subunit
MPIERCRAKNNIFESGTPFGINGLRIDGNNVLKVYQAALEAVERCRKNQGPALIECLTYRLHGHVGPDDNIFGYHTDIRPRSEVEKWRKKDPLAGFESFLLKRKIINRKDIQKIRLGLEKEVRDAHLFARSSPYPSPNELTRYVYREK